MRRYNRRDFMKTSLAAGAGLAATGMMGGLTPQAQAAVTLDFKGWNYMPDLVRENINLFEKQYPDIKVKYEAFGGNYNDKMAALFVAKSPLDCLYVRDTYFAAWVEAGWLRDIEGLPGVEEYKKMIYAGNIEAMTYDGKLYGLPYYTDFHVWAYREDILKKAGFNDGGRTLQDVHDRAMAIKKKGIMKYPIAFPFKFQPWGNWPWWAINYASGANFFDKKGDPIMHEDPRFARILEWFMDGIYKYEYIDPKVVEMAENTGSRDSMAAGKYAYGAFPKYDVQRVNDPKFSKVPGKIKMMEYPSLEPDQHGTVSWTRMYSLTEHVKKDRIDAAWKLIQYLGGKDKNGELYTAKRWYMLKGLGFGYPEVWDDKDVMATTSKWADVSVIKAIGKTSRPIEIIKTPWYYDFERDFIATIQLAITRKKSVKETLDALAKLAKKVKKDWD